MQTVTREAIKQMASSEKVYYRGMRYYAAHAVSGVTWNETGKMYRGNVQGSNMYQVSVQIREDGDIVYSCNCPASVRHKGACKHVVSLMLFVADYNQRQYVQNNMDSVDKTAYGIVEYFRKREYNKLTPVYFRLELQITVPEFLKSHGSKVFVSLRAGSGKMYKVSNIKKFICDYYEGNIIDLGKEFHFVPEECAFEDNSRRVMDYLVEIYEIQEALGRTYYSNLFERQEMALSKNMLCKLLDRADGLNCSLNIYGTSVENISIAHGNPKLSISLEMQDGELCVKNENEHKLTSLCEDGTILYYDKKLYIPDEAFITSLLPFYGTLFGSSDRELMFRDQNKNSFIEKVLPVVRKNMDVKIPKSMSDKYVVETISPELYLDTDTSKKRLTLTARVKFRYGSYVVEPLGQEPSGNFILVRDYDEEERLIRLLYDWRFKVFEDYFVMKHEEDIFSLMAEGIQKLSEKFQIFYSKSYKSISVKKPGSMSANIRFNTDINLLEMDLDYNQIPRQELEDFFRAIHLKKRYYRLKKGGFIDLDVQNGQLESLRWFLENGTDTGDGVLRFDASRAAYLDSLLPKSNRIHRDKVYTELLEDMTGSGHAGWQVPDCVNANLREYQVTGYQWLKTLSKYGMGGILADDMGLGKTLQTIVYICSFPDSKSLIVCPTSVTYNWQEEFEKFAPHIRTCIVSGTPEERDELINGHMEEFDVWITTYALIRKDVEFYREREFDHMFIDEAQFIKNSSSLGAKAVKSVKAAHRFALTGTPIENALSELWSIFDFIMPGYFPKYTKFAQEFEKSIIQEKNEAKMKELKKRIQPFILRRMKKDVLRDLPDKIETKIMAQMSKKQHRIYLSYLSRIQTELVEHGTLESSQGRIQVLAALTRLRQICCHPGTFVDNYTGGSGKMELLMEQLPDMLDAGHSIIIFSQFTSMLSIIADSLKDRQIPFFYLAGSTKAVDRKNYVRQFNQGEVRVFLISLKAGGTGLNLTGADTVIHFDPWWNPAVEEQATDRAYRIGQKRKVQVIKYVMKDSIEEKIYELQKRKKLLSESVIAADEVFVNQLTREELAELFEIPV